MFNIRSISILGFLLDLVLFLWVWVLFVVQYFALNNYNRVLLVSLFLWAFLSLLTLRFYKLNVSRGYWRNVSSHIKFYLLLFFVVFIINYYIFEKYEIIFSVLIYILWSFVLQTYLYLRNRIPNSDEINLHLLKATTYPELENIKSNNKLKTTQKKDFISSEIREYVENALKEETFFLNLFFNNINNIKIAKNNINVIRTTDLFNLRAINDNSLIYFINLHTLNDFRRINEYLILLNRKLRKEGVFISKFEPIRFRYKRFLKKYPRGIAQIFYFFDFLWKRVSPKLPFIQKFYFAITKGKDRAVSLAEVLGRLYYSGFEIVTLKEVDNFIYFVAKKVKAPSEDANPSYGPLFKMKRVGQNGKTFYVYKLRTMHPYSEYLQEFIVEKSGYDEVGKPKNDFRVTNWGRIVRKFWLDEIPQLINVMKGEMKLVGVRPLSEFRFNELPIDLRKRRIQYKPGCIPPYVSLNMPDAEGNIKAEIIYLDQKEKQPILTDIKFFFLAIYNIFFRKMRSG